MELLTENGKMKKTNKANPTYRIFNWGIPAWRSKLLKMIVCHNADKCGRDGGCYAQQGSYNWPGTINAYEQRLELSLTDQFIGEMVKAIAVKKKTSDKRGQQLVIRIHDSGDFYDKAYWLKWRAVIEAYPDVKFYAYTKMVALFKSMILPDNFRPIYSEGGKQDKLINHDTDRHCRIFGNLLDLVAAGYTDVGLDDLITATTDATKLGIVYHGYKSKEWSTAS